jgi:hypothetical protein
MSRSGFLLCTFIAMSAVTVEAQIEPGPLPIVAADVRAAIPRFKADPSIAGVLGVGAEDLPTRGLGFVAGAHVYPLRFDKITFGFGAEILGSRARRTRAPAAEGQPEGPTIETRFRAISPQISFNFGHRDGWSYISGGMGWASLTSERATPEARPDDGRRKTINYGGGARWFAKKHLALSLDLRFYAVSPRTATAGQPGYPRMTVIVFSGGVAFRQAASRPRRHSSNRRAALPATECSDGCHPSARARGLRTI